MNKEKFLEELAFALNRDEQINESMMLKDLPEWDSLGIMCVVTLLEDTYQKSLTFDDLSKFNTVKDLVDAVER
jgi:acyl carrier protein